MCSKYSKQLTPKGMKGSVFESNIWGFDQKLTSFVKNRPQNRRFYQIKHQMHSCDTIILLEKVYFTISNNLTKNLCVASVSSLSSSSLNVRKLAKIGKNVYFGSDTHISDVKMNSFNTFSIKENITGKTASGFSLFGKIQGQKSQFMNLALSNSSKLSCMSSLPASMKRIRSKAFEKT